MNKLDLFLSAQAAAVDSLGARNNLEIHNLASTRFQAEGLDQRDWDFWKQSFDSQRQICGQFAKEKAATQKPQK